MDESDYDYANDEVNAEEYDPLVPACASCIIAKMISGLDAQERAQACAWPKFDL